MTILACGSSRQHDGLVGDRQVSKQISKQLEILFKNDCGLATLFKTLNVLRNKQGIYHNNTNVREK